MQLQGGVGHTIGEAGIGDLLSPAAALSAGYRFNPLWGIRLGVSGWQAKGAWVVPFTSYKYNYLQGNVDATLDLSNLFCKYNPDRVFNAYLLAGVGLNYAFNNDEAMALGNDKLQYLWEDNKMFVAGRVGLGTNIRLSKQVAFNVELNSNILSDKFNSKKAGNVDWQSNLLVGLTIKFGKKSKPVPAPAPAPEPVQEVVPAPAPAPAPAPVVEEKIVEVEPLTENVFFELNSSVIRASEEGKIANLVSYLNKYPEAKVIVTGHADAATGNEKINMRLSEERAAVVEKALKDKGIAADRIKAEFNGDKVQPFSTPEENRVTICIAK